MSFDAVRRFRDRLRELGPPPDTGLSPEGARAAAEAALDALSDDALARVASMPVQPFRTAAVVAARTVFSAPLEWCAVLLGRGTQVRLKVPAAAPGWGPQLARAAAGLPLVVTHDRGAVRGVELVVAMASDATITDLRRSLAPTTRFLPHGHRFSVAWVARDWEGLAEDLALHDGRGCLSPVIVFTPRPLAEACDALAGAMARAEAAWPRGEVAPIEGARIRSREALARVTGIARVGPGFSVHGLRSAPPEALPRAPAVVSVPDVAAAVAALGADARWLSTVGTDDPSSAEAWLSAGASRICPPGRMQRPPLHRMHDGEDWLVATARAVGVEL